MSPRTARIWKFYDIRTGNQKNALMLILIPGELRTHAYYICKCAVALGI